MNSSIKNLSREDILSAIGLQTRRTAVDMLLPGLGIFGAGLLIGAGVALLVAPKTGAQTRAGIGDSLGRMASSLPWNGARRPVGDHGHVGNDGIEVEARNDPTRADPHNGATPHAVGPRNT